MVEVGATNKTHASDYERAITSDTAMLLKGAHLELPHHGLFGKRDRPRFGERRPTPRTRAALPPTRATA